MTIRKILTLLLCLAAALIPLAGGIALAAEEAPPLTYLQLNNTAKLGPGDNDTLQNGYKFISYYGGSGSDYVDIKLPFNPTAQITSGITITPDYTLEGQPLESSNIFMNLPDNTTYQSTLAANPAAEYAVTFTGLKIKNDATLYDGVYPVQFKAEYQYDHDGNPATIALPGTQYFTVYVSVQTRGAEPTEAPEPTPTPTDTITETPVDTGIIDGGSSGGGGGGSGLSSVPRIIISGYTYAPQEIFAGDTFNLEIKIRNTSTKSRVQNIKMSMKSDDSTILPVGGTNTVYQERLEKDTEESFNFQLQVQPNADPKTYNLTLDLAYEDKSANPLTDSATIAIPIRQQIRVELDNPIIQADGMEGEPVPLSMNVYNLGKSTLYNLKATVEGNYMRAEQSYFGGNMESGASKTVELNIITETPAEEPVIDGGGLVPEDVSPEELQRMQEQDGLIDEGAVGSSSGDFLSGLLGSTAKAAEAPAAEAAPIGGIDTGDITIDVNDTGSDDAAVSDTTDSTLPESDVANGEYAGRVKITFEDEYGKEYTEYQEFSFTMVSQAYYEDPTWGEPILPEEPVPEQGGFPWLYVGIGGGVLLVIIIILLVRRSVRRKKLLQDEMV